MGCSKNFIYLSFSILFLIILSSSLVSALCQEGDYQCTGDILEYCKGDIWSEVYGCGYGCEVDHCRNCEETNTRCNSVSGDIEVCSGDAWIQQQSCSYGCNITSSQCLTQPQQIPSYGYCDEGENYKCHSDGLTLLECQNGEWEISEVCQTGCTNNACEICNENELQCDGIMLQKCIANQWTDFETCTFSCENNQCQECEYKSYRCQSTRFVEGGINPGILEICSRNPNKASPWEYFRTCEYGCFGDQCSICIENQQSCDSNAQNIVECQNNSLVEIQTCSNGCINNACRSCAEYERDCSSDGTEVLTCISDTWETLQTCNYGCSNEVCCSADGTCDSASSNRKELSKYSNKEVFLISDQDWKEIIPLVPVTTWTDDSNIMKYPTLIYHREEEKFDVDSIIHFLQQYNPDKVTIVGSLAEGSIGRDRSVYDLLLASPPTGAGLPTWKLNLINPNNYLSYWHIFDSVVYVEEDYELALLASTYASLINSPLIIEGTPSDSRAVFVGRDVICVGAVSPSESSCTETYTLEQLQRKYLAETNTDKILLVNPNDLDIKVHEWISPAAPPFRLVDEIYNVTFLTDKSGVINELYSKMSLSAPILASAKHELIISDKTINYSDFTQVDQFIENKINDLGILANYLTIVASPNAIEMLFENPQPYFSAPEYLSTDSTYYAQIDSDDFIDLAVGRIFGVTVSDASSNIARSLYYEETLKNPERMLFQKGYDAFNSATNQYVLSKIMQLIGYSAYADIGQNNDRSRAEEWRNKFFIFYDDHGAIDWAGFNSRYIPYLDNSFVIADACSTCNFKEIRIQYSGRLFCANAIRKGAVGYIGSTDLSPSLTTAHDYFIPELFANEENIGIAFRNTINAFMKSPSGHAMVPLGTSILLGDPTFKPIITHKLPVVELPRRPASQCTSCPDDYLLTIPAVKVTIPEDIKNLDEYPSWAINPSYFSTSYLLRGFYGSTHRGFTARIKIDDNFEPYDITGPEYSDSPDSRIWEFEIEETNDGKYLWVYSPYSAFFTDTTEAGFSSYGFPLTLPEGGST